MGEPDPILFWTPGENFKVLVNNYKSLQQIAWQVTFFCPKTLRNGLKFKKSPYFSILPRISHNFREGGGGSPPDPKILGPYIGKNVIVLHIIANYIENGATVRRLFCLKIKNGR